MNAIRKILVALSALFLFTLAAGACEWTKKNNCGYNPDPGIHYSGTGHPTNMVEATVCYGEWNDLAGPDRWWGPTLRRGGWSADRPAIHARCYKQWVVKGTRIESDSACTAGKVLTTPPINRAGTYELR